jgi:nitrite reductase (NADH) small subunit
MTTAAPTTKIALCVLDDVAVGLGRAFDVGGRSVAVFRSRDDKVFAVEGKCPHKGGPLADGMLIGEQVVCPLHAFRFGGTTGECDQANVCAIEAFPADVQNGTVYVTVPVA